MIKDLTRGRLTPKNNSNPEYIPQRLNLYSTEDSKTRPKSRETLNKSTDMRKRQLSESKFNKSNTNNNSKINYSENCKID